MKQKLEELIDEAPPGHYHPKVQKNLAEIKGRLSKVAELMDDLGRVDERTQAVYVDENTLRKLVKEAFPGSEDAVIKRLQRLPGSNLTKVGQRMRRIPWETLGERMLPPTASAGEAASVRLTPYSSLQEIRQAVQQQFPDISDNAFEPETLNRACKAAFEVPGAVGSGAADASPSYVWDCMVRHMGFFGAIAFVGVAVTIVTLFAMALAYTFSPIGSAYWATLSIFVAVLSLRSQYYAWAVGIIMRCVTNPSA